MKSAAIPNNELARLNALDEYNILDTLAEQAYDQLTDLASSVCGTPIALISLIDEKRQWFKSHHGLDAQETPREIAFCAHAIHHDELFEIQDSRKDQRFHDNPLVTGPTQVIFYAGAPLVTPSGLRLGTLCVIDNKPSYLTALQKKQLIIIAQQVVTQLELRKAGRIQHDLLAQSRSLEQSLLLTKSLEVKNKELEQFVYTVSHDLKSPLVTINGFTSMLAKELSAHTTEKQKHRFQRILENLTHMGDLLTNLLELSRVMKAEISKAPIDLTTLIEQNWQRLITGYKEVEVELVLTKPLHAIGANQTLLSQCIDNLLSNAIRYRSAERDLTLKIHTEELEASVSLFISDNGIGIAKSDHKRVFNVFEQINPGQGTGIGLSLVKAAMEKHNGSVSLVSELGQGSCFELRFPKT
ncbi:GAF domain-containing sensor histidine kinase [Colwellia sp. MB02u-18]|uniref:sensor histidine kinase n=1 Tax=unclassified Colwellia TaxID=196834 RepID=UPI0015F36206|nr:MULTISPECIES: GAF domain-containing sensor histidine kinase [unclassified Colwellia]MBA6225395.1 GAF domain-containing sensor histidine kinase [Colwellia sp. MB3u-45]MBA6266613.1 GAF domain-containing sensor histidine kinase [Colwellia sp. MB3u-43]MBA6320738.1 GAF domain-containing sensor histidine kinase [Colwellia sp. MB02u-19]MBA6323253.1 GAF domain-containing sensor histidine kinase [Colwellia sp. MB02u-18]MBA6329655.1 GAF domain-containing sensor histidine kinase [Colwellia sp. MB02u-1